MQQLNDDEDMLYPPGVGPEPTDPDTAYDILFPTSPLNERPAEDDDGLPLYPPWVKQDQGPLMDD